MHVVHVIARLNVGGTARYIEQVVAHTKSLGIESTVITGSVQGAEREDPLAEKLRLIRIPELSRAIDPRKDFLAAKEIKQAIERVKPDVVHSHTFKAGALTRIAISEQPVIHTFHGHLLDDPEFQGFKKNVIVAAERALAPRARKLVTVGQRVAQDLLARGIGTSEQYVSIPPGVTPLEQQDKLWARQQLRLAADATVVAWVARVTGVKAPHRVIEIALAHPDITFVIAGGGDLENDVRARAPRNVVVLGWQPASVVFSAADVVLSTSENEGMPVALIEAQMMGLPVVATDVGAVAEVVQHGVTGLVGRAADLSHFLSSVLLSKAMRDQMGSAAKERSRKEFGVSTLASRHADLYHKVLRLAQ